MSNEKTQPQQQQQQPAQTDMLDAQYKPIGISAVSAAACLKTRKPEQMR